MAKKISDMLMSPRAYEAYGMAETVASVLALSAGQTPAGLGLGFAAISSFAMALAGSEEEDE